MDRLQAMVEKAESDVEFAREVLERKLADLEREVELMRQAVANGHAPRAMQMTDVRVPAVEYRLAMDNLRALKRLQEAK